MNNIPKFKCLACGNCCSKIAGFISEEEKKFINEYAYGKLPLIQLVSTEELSFPLWDFEAKRFREYQKIKNIDAKITPSRGILDSISNKFIIFTYQMNYKGCPFLASSGKCTIYDKKRALICYLFPFNRSPFLDVDVQDSKDIFGNCQALNDIFDKFDYKNKKTLIKQLNDSFDDIFIAAVEHDNVIEWSNNLVVELMKKKLINPVFNQPYKFLKKKIDAAEKIDLTDFLVESGYKSRDEINKLIERINELQDAKEKFTNYIK